MRRAATLALVAIAAVGSLWSNIPAIAQAQPPNVLLIITDDQRVGTFAMMPAVRRWFINRGTTFSRAFAVNPLCCPSRASILTGTYPHNHGVNDNLGGEQVISVQDDMIQASLKGVGYRTGLVGKFLNGFPNDVNPSWFDRWTVTPRIDYSGAEWNVDGSVQVIDQNSTSYIGDRTVGFLRDAEYEDETPWFLHVGFMAPHMPATVEPRYQAQPIPALTILPSMREQDRRDKPSYVRTQPLPTVGSIEFFRRPQLRSLAAVDDQIDRIMRRLAQLGEAADTLAIFTSDNGMLWGEHGRFRKTVPYERSIRVPLMLLWPGRVDAGVVDDRLVANVDIAPTVQAATGSQPRVVPDGIDLLRPDLRRLRLLLEFDRVPDWDVPTWRAFRSRSAIYVEYLRADGTVSFREFYRLDLDPHELTNRLRDGTAANDPDLESVAARLAALVGCAGQACVV